MATKLRLYREKARLTQAKLAQRVGMSERSYNSHEKGVAGICRVWNRIAIAAVLGVNEDRIFTKEGKAKS